VRAKLGVALADMVAIDGDGLGWTVYEGVVWVRRKLMTAKKRAKQAGSPIILEAKACARRQRNHYCHPSRIQAPASRSAAEAAIFLSDGVHKTIG